MMRRKTIAVLLALIMTLCVGIPAAGAITQDDMDNAPELALWEETEATIATGGAYVYFKILPDVTCTYTMYSAGSKDTMGYLYSADGTQLAYNDDGGENRNFRITQELTGGETYYLGINFWSTTLTGSFSVVLEGHNIEEWTTVTEPTCTDPGEETGTCSLCGETITREIAPLGHAWGEATSDGSGMHTHTCERCHVTETEPCTYEDHSDGGFTTHTCTQCGYSYTNESTGEGRVALWDFEEEPTDWTFVDADGDGYNWEWEETSYAYEGSHCLYSASYVSGTALSPDNWAISPAFSLIGADSTWVNLWVMDSYYDDIIALYAGTSMDPDSMTKISEDISPDSSYEQFAIDLSDFAGEPFVYLAIRHYNCTDQYYVLVDYVEVSATYAECTDHVLVEVPAAEATCTEGGHIAHWACENCGRMYYDEEGTEPAMPDDVFNSSPLGHDWGEAVSNDNGTHTYTCDRCHETRTEDCTFETHMEDGVVVDVCTECGYTVHSDLIAYWDFEKEPVDWWFYDGDGDGYNWEWNYGRNWYYHDGSGMIQSASWYGGSALSPDNYAVSPAFSLAEYTGATLSAWARGQDTTYNNEVFAFYAGTSYDPSDWVKVSEDYTTDGEYREYTADLSDFIGEPVVHIAIRHYNLSDMFWLNVDDVSIKSVPVDPCEEGHHTMTYVPAKEPTETEDGNVAYYVCGVCGLFYLDEDGTQPVSALDVILPGGYPVAVDETIEHGVVATILTRAKEGELVPLYINPDWGGVLDYLAYVDEAGRETVIATPADARDSVPMGVIEQPDVKSAAKSEAKVDAKSDVKFDAKSDVKSDAKRQQQSHSKAPVDVTKAETEIDSNFFTMPASAVTVVAEFGPKYTVTLDPGDAGGDLLYITSLDEGVWAESSATAGHGQFYTYSGSDAFNLPDNPFTWNNHTFVNWLMVIGNQSGTANPGGGYYAHDYTLIAQWSEDELADGYYLIGPDWTFEAIDADELFGVNPGNENEYMLSTQLTAGDEIKVIHLTNNVIDAWYPDGEDTQYHVDAAHAGLVNIYFQTTYNNAWSEFGGYFYIEKGAEPEFKTQSLTLEGKIGVNFYMDLSMLSAEDLADAEKTYMTFTISGKGTVDDTPVPVSENQMNSKGTLYGFTCYVNSIQMADTITATFHYGDGLTVEKTYSIAEYIASFEENHSQFSDEIVALVHALADYGHYTQLFLQSTKGLPLGDGDDQYAPMELCYTAAEDYDTEEITGQLWDCEIMVGAGDSSDPNIKSLTYTLVLDSATTLRVIVKPVSGFTGDLNVYDSLTEEASVVPLKSKRWTVEFTNIPAHLLGQDHLLDMYTDAASYGEDSYIWIWVSPMSYALQLLSSSNDAAQNAGAALYSYWQAAKALKEAN